jgi:hypothetical protein
MLAIIVGTKRRPHALGRKIFVWLQAVDCCR